MTGGFPDFVVFTGMSQQGEPSFMAPGSSPPGNMMQGRMGGPQNTLMSGMQAPAQGGSMYPSGDMKGWPQGSMPRNKYVASRFLRTVFKPRFSVIMFL